jgi:hypothetical protein
LRSHRRIAGELADLAPRWIRMGLVERHEIVNTIESDKVGVFITPKLFFLNDRFFRSYLARCYQKPQRFPRATGQGHGIPDIYVFPHRTGINCRANVPRK